MAIQAIDVSTWQSGIDFNAVKAAGISAVLIRAGYGREVSQKDSQFENHYKGAKAAGLKVGVYWYSYADSVSDARKEAQACLSVLNNRNLDLPVYYDMEESSQAYKDVTGMAIEFCDTVIASGYNAGVYANYNWFANYLDYDLLRSRYSIWLAQWGSIHSLACDIWQYSEKGRVSGISGNVDMNYVLNESIINGSGGGTKEATVELTVKILAKSGYTNSGEQVKTIQRLLSSMGYKGSDGKALTIDGIFGANTEYAVKKYQTANKLSVDGIVGSNTWKRITGAT